MNNWFADTNIIIDLIADREPFSSYAKKIFLAAEQQKIKVFTSSHSYATIYYVLKKYTNDETLRKILLTLLDYVSIIRVDEHIIKISLQSSYKDFEDAIQIFCAGSVVHIIGILTRNVKDFKPYTGIYI